ncbi:MAG: DUF3006 domain-containing protein [Halarsenatibacteraceae bacterium]
MKVTVDRIENDISVMLIRPDEKHSIEIPLKHLPDKIDEGDILKLTFEKMEKETKAAEKRVGELLNKLKNKNK